MQGLHLLLHPVQAAAPLAGQAARPHQAGEDHLLLLLHPGGGVTIIGLSQGSIFYMLPPPPPPAPRLSMLMPVQNKRYIKKVKHTKKEKEGRKNKM